MNLIDSYDKAKASRVNKAATVPKKNHPTYQSIASVTDNILKEDPKPKFYDGKSTKGKINDFDSVSKATVTTPHTRVSRRPDEVSFYSQVTAVTKITNQTTKQ